MSTLSSRSARAAWAISSLVLCAAPSVVHAEPGVCDLDATGMRTCGAPTSCVTRATCIAGAGTDDNTCQSIASGTATRICLPDCSTMFTCNDAADCPARVNGVTPTCSPAANGGTTLPSVCTYTTTMPGFPPSAQISYCVSPGNHISPSQITLCHRRAGALTTFTTDYYQGDCDGDGCPNGHDSNPCANDGGCAATTVAFESPFCAPLPALACSISDAGLSCGDARPCSTAPMALACAAGAQCEDGWSDVPRCRPACSTLFLCAPGALMGGGAPPEQCPMLDGATGVCAPLPGTIAPVQGRTGFCVYSDFFDTSCATGALSDQCLRAPDGNLTSNFYAGDCDGDGAPNGCDALRCADGGGTSMCVDVVGDGCMPSYTPPADAGVDGGADAGSTTDAGDTDGGSNIQPDASTEDAGNTMSDASIGIDGGVAASFSGGGGCRCAAAGVQARPIAGTALWMLLLGLVMRRRAGR